MNCESKHQYRDLFPETDPLRALQDENTQLKIKIRNQDDEIKKSINEKIEIRKIVKQYEEKVSTVLFSSTARFNYLHTGRQSGGCGRESVRYAECRVQADHGHVRVYRKSGKGRRDNRLPQRKMRGAGQDVLPEYRSEDEGGLCREVEQICSHRHFTCAAALRLHVLRSSPFAEFFDHLHSPNSPNHPQPGHVPRLNLQCVCSHARIRAHVIPTERVRGTDRIVWIPRRRGRQTPLLR